MTKLYDVTFKQGEAPNDVKVRTRALIIAAMDAALVSGDPFYFCAVHIKTEEVTSILGGVGPGDATIIVEDILPVALDVGRGELDELLRTTDDTDLKPVSDDEPS